MDIIELYALLVLSPEPTFEDERSKNYAFQEESAHIGLLTLICVIRVIPVRYFGHSFLE